MERNGENREMLKQLDKSQGERGLLGGGVVMPPPVSSCCCMTDKFLLIAEKGMLSSYFELARFLFLKD